MRAMADELVRRFRDRRARSRAHLTDAELWVTPETWEQVRALVSEAAELVHAEALPPRTTGTRAREHERRAVRDEAAMRLRDSLAPLREPRFAWFYAARVVSTVGTTMAPIALAFAVLDISDSASALGIVLAARTLPMVLFLLVGGVVADRFPRATVLITANLLAALTQAAVAVLVISGTAEIWMLVALEAANGVVSAFIMPAMEGVVPQLAPRDHLQQANALLSFSRSGLAILGPTLPRCSSPVPARAGRWPSTR